ncbi:hypothetical protein FGO68_gene6562 [Halteria grandinella]|uniref:Uncharacterized protein n=1 Tax=Halteria grandinella TaxID=5974 RepID=A0A8J8T646_HALGN|nr:hypothetical protein FGO68_gene6562 [Halteria grandinella]
MESIIGKANQMKQTCLRASGSANIRITERYIETRSVFYHRKISKTGLLVASIASWRAQLKGPNRGLLPFIPLLLERPQFTPSKIGQSTLLLTTSLGNESSISD